MTNIFHKLHDQMMDEWHAERVAERANDVAKLVPPLYRDVKPNQLHKSLAGWKPGQSVYLHGPSGSGKSHQLALLAKSYASTSLALPVWFDAIELIDRLRRSQRDDSVYPSGAFLAGTVVIDDLGKQRVTEYALEQLFHLVNHAYQHQRTLLVSSELSPAELGKRTSYAIARRLMEMTNGGLELKRRWWSVSSN